MNSSEIKNLLKDRKIGQIIELIKCDPTVGPSVLSAILMLAEEAKEKYREKGISDKIYNDTMADISVWTENYYRKTGYCGIEEIGWIMNHLNLELFALGRLQFRPAEFYYNDSWTDLADSPLTIGDKIMEIHISQGCPLAEDECNSSFFEAPEFFKKYFDYDFDYYTCHSWLLSPILKSILPESSNIIKFQNRFTLIASDQNDGQAEERIFDKQFGSNTNSSLAKKTLELNRKGIKIGAGIGIIRKEDIK
ncbi:MAG: DUF5596 domain-containing protein [Clostridia bacterium]|nr:DUF5596 domain-containing protein [Clostridia bacterium]